MSSAIDQGHAEADRSVIHSAVVIQALALYALENVGGHRVSRARATANELSSIRDNVLSWRGITFDDGMLREAENRAKPLQSTKDTEKEWSRHSGAWSALAYELFKEGHFGRKRLMEIFIEMHFGDRIIGFGRCEGEKGEKLRMLTMDEGIGKHLIPEVSIITEDPINPQTGRPYRFFLVLTDMNAYRFDEMQWKD